MTATRWIPVWCICTQTFFSVLPLAARNSSVYEKVHHELMQTAHFRQDDSDLHSLSQKLSRVLHGERASEFKKSQAQWSKDLEAQVAREANPQDFLRNEVLRRKEELEGMLGLAQGGENFLVGKWEFLAGKSHSVYEFKPDGTLLRKRGEPGKWWFDPAKSWLIIQWHEGEATAIPVRPKAKDHVALDNFLSRNDVDLYRMKAVAVSSASKDKKP